MKIVIDIPEAAYKLLQSDEGVDWLGAEHILQAVSSGEPLPKGHGRLVDISKIDKDRMESDNPIIYLTINGQYTEALSLDYLNDLPTIIEADTEEGEV